MPRRPQPDTKPAAPARRAVAVATAALVLMATPGIAKAAFTGKVSGQLSASTLTLTAPAGASVTAACASGRKLTVTVNSYGTVPRATSYEFILLNPSGAAVPTTNGSYSESPAARGVWTYQIRGLYAAGPTNTWTGTPYQGTVTCA